jgi:aspartyl-tRNA(Asn)/glutamyl-tRNA(Gln) amidotransferase subunit A
VTIVEAGCALRVRKISCVELTAECLRRIANRNRELNAFITVTADTARERAAALDDELARGFDRGPLHGIPIAHKDLFHTRGVRTTAGSKLYEDFIPSNDARAVEQLDAAGTVMLGKTGLHELAYGVTSNNPHFGPVRNPVDPRRTPGGSSGGSASALAAGMCLLATGTDTGGSIRIPASFCGVAGLKPTYGRISRAGVIPLGLSLDHVGPMAADVAGLRAAFAVLAGGAGRAVTRSPARIGLPENFFFDRVDAEVRDAIHAAARAAEDAGFGIVPVRVPDIDTLNAVGRVILLAEASALYDSRLDRPDLFGADVLSLLEQGRLVPASAYVNAQRLRKALAREFQALFTKIDALFTPTTPIPAPLIGEAEIIIDGNREDARLASTRFVRGFNVLGLPALSIPCGRTSSGLPIGLQIVGRAFEDEFLLDIAAALEPA